MAVTFDGIQKRILVTGVTSVDVQRDLYSGWKRWVRAAANAKFQQAMRPVGGDSIGGGQQSPAYFFLLNDWKIIVSGENVNFASNIYCDELSNSNTFPFVVSGGGAVSYKISDSPVVTVSSGSGLSPDQDAKLTSIRDKTDTIPDDVWRYQR